MAVVALRPKRPADFLKAHDQNTIVPERFRKGIKALGPSGWMYYNDFLRTYSISPPQGAAYREQFAKFMLEADKKIIVCGSEKLATQFKKAIA